jgi:uncharacterized damage-inducible protein DinB
MNFLSSIRELYQHMQWADAKAWKAVLSNSNAAPDSVLRDRLLHIHLVQQAFFHVWRGAAFDPQAVISAHTEMSAIAELGRKYHSEVIEFLATLDDATLESPLVLPWTEMITAQLGQEITTAKMGETMIQVAMHSTYHRGQVGSRLRELGSEPPLTDFIVWVWTGKQQADWPSFTP